MQHAGPYFRLFQSMDRVRRAWHSIEPCEGVSKSEFFTLINIAHCGAPPPLADSTAPRAQREGIALSALASSMHQSLPAISQRISVLEASGYVQRASGADRRVSAVHLTDAGQALLEKAFASMRTKLDAVLECMTQAERETLLALLERLAGSFEALSQSPLPPEPRTP